MIPSRKTLGHNLGLSVEQSLALRHALEKAGSGNPEDVDTALDLASGYLAGYGVEAIRGEHAHGYYGDVGALYVNVGDTYRATLLFDTRTEQFRCMGGWGDWIEWQEKQGRTFV